MREDGWRATRDAEEFKKMKNSCSEYWHLSLISTKFLACNERKRENENERKLLLWLMTLNEREFHAVLR